MKLYPDSMKDFDRPACALHMARPSFSLSGASLLDDDRDERYNDRMEVYFERTEVFADDIDPDDLTKRFDRWEEKVEDRFCVMVATKRAAHAEQALQRQTARYAEAERTRPALMSEPGFAAIGIGAGACGLLLLGGTIAFALQAIVEYL